MNYFLDTEFSERGYARVDLISIALVRADGKEYYAVATDGWAERTCNAWVRANVLPKLSGEPRTRRAQIARDIVDLIGDDEKPIFWAYYGDYDWVLFCQLFGTMMDLPTHFPRWCRDLKQLSVDLGSPPHPPPPPPGEHNALADAHWNRQLWLNLMAIQRQKKAILDELHALNTTESRQ